MTKAYMVVEVEFDPAATDAIAVSDALDILMDTAKSTPGILDDHGEVRVGGFFPVDPEDIQHLEAISHLPLTQPQKDAMANILHRLGVLEVPEL